MQFGTLELAACDSPIAEHISKLQGEYGVLMASIVGKDWSQCSETMQRCRTAYGELFDYPAEQLRHYASDIQQLQLINKQTLEFLDTLRAKRANQLAQLRQGQKIHAHYSQNLPK